MPDYVNSHGHDVHLVGPDGKKVHIRHGATVRLPAFFDRYVKRGILKNLRTPVKTTSIRADRVGKYKPSKALVLRSTRQKLRQAAGKNVTSIPAKLLGMPSSSASPVGDAKKTIRRINRRPKHVSKLVGRSHSSGATNSLHKTISNIIYPISNNIGIGILCFNRPQSLRRLVNSLIRFTDLRRTTVFISDDGSTDVELAKYLAKLGNSDKFVVLRNEKRLGIAGNSNRLLRCLQRFNKKILLNDDVEVLQRDWDQFYFTAMRITGMHHFCVQQPGVYGSPEGIRQDIKGVSLSKIEVRPHGAVMAIDQLAFEKIGYFDEEFGFYGMEHVDWSSRVSDTKLQPPGFFDVRGSLEYFKIYPDRSAVPDRVQHLQKARARYKTVAGRKGFVAPSNQSNVPSISCVIPFRDVDRHGAIKTAFNNIRAQRFPHIEIIAAEHDVKAKFSHRSLGSQEYVTVKSGGKPFNKSMAFNAGVAKASHERLLLHDADTLVPAHYAQLIFDALDMADSCHLGARVLYADRESTGEITANGIIDRKITAEKIVTYFEGGSIACRRDIFWRVGGFVEGYWGYGCEDCDFYYRLSKASRWYENRTIDLIHLHHSRTSGWIQLHETNKAHEKSLAMLSLNERIARQHKYFKRTAFNGIVRKALGNSKP